MPHLSEYCVSALPWDSLRAGVHPENEHRAVVEWLAIRHTDGSHLHKFPPFVHCVTAEEQPLQDLLLQLGSCGMKNCQVRRGLRYTYALRSVLLDLPALETPPSSGTIHTA